MNKATIVVHDTTAMLESPVTVKAISQAGLPGPKGDKGDTGDQGVQGPGILSNIVRITASATPPDSPELNDLWIDIS